MHKLKNQRVEIFKKVFPFIKDQNYVYFLLGVIKICNLLLSLIAPTLYLILIDGIMIKKRLQLLPFVIGGYIGIYFLQTLNIVLNKRYYNKLFLKFNLKIKTKMLSIFSKMDVKLYTKYNVGDLKNRIDGDIGIVQKFFTSHFLDYYYAIVNAFVLAFILIFMNWILALTSFLMIPLSFWFVKIMGKRSQNISEKQRKMQGEYESFLHVSFQSWKQIKANNLEKNKNDEFQNYRNRLSKLFVKNQIYWFINRTFIAFKDFFITHMNLYFVGGLLIINEHIGVGILLAFMNYYKQFFSNISAITDSMLGLKNDIPNINRVLEIINTEIIDKPKINKLNNNISINNLNFRYYDEQPLILNDIRLSITPNDHIAIVGRSGCGKTTLAKLIIGLYKPLSGNIYLGDVDINKIAFKSVGRKIGIVLQEPPLFNLTIRENLQFVKKSANDDELIIACKKANIYNFIDGLPDGFDTIIGECGVKLSGGQKQLLSIARTLLQNPDIIIFDEATSSLDSENEKAIIGAMKELSQGKTVITIAHRLSTILECNRVIVMDNGKIVANDTHKNLRGRNGIYDLLFEKQYNLM